MRYGIVPARLTSWNRFVWKRLTSTMKDLITKDSDLVGIKHLWGEILNIYADFFEYFVILF